MPYCTTSHAPYNIDNVQAKVDAHLHGNVSLPVTLLIRIYSVNSYNQGELVLDYHWSSGYRVLFINSVAFTTKVLRTLDRTHDLHEAVSLWIECLNTVDIQELYETSMRVFDG